MLDLPAVYENELASVRTTFDAESMTSTATLARAESAKETDVDSPTPSPFGVTACGLAVRLVTSSGAGPGVIRITSPEGKLLGFLNLPILGGHEPKRQICATNEAFGGDGKDLYISTCDAVYKIRLKATGIVPGPDGKLLH